MRTSLLGSAFVVVGLAALPGQAATIVQTAYTSLGEHGSSASPFNFFNGSLGALTSVTLDDHSSIGVSYQIFLNNITGSAVLHYTVADIVTTLYSSGVFTTAASAPETVSGSTPANNSSASVTIVRDRSYSLDYALGNFVRSGTFIVMDYSSATYSAYLDPPDGPQSGYLIQPPHGFLIDNYTLTYTYTPGGITAGIPEPASWAMMLGGFGMIGAAMRRQRAWVSLG